MCYWSKTINKVGISFSITHDYTDSPAGPCANRVSPHHLHHPARGSTLCGLYSPSPLPLSPLPFSSLPPPLLLSPPSPPPLSPLPLLCGMASIRSAWWHHQWLLWWHHHALLPACNRVVHHILPLRHCYVSAHTSPLHHIVFWLPEYILAAGTGVFPRASSADGASDTQLQWEHHVQCSTDSQSEQRSYAVRWRLGSVQCWRYTNTNQSIQNTNPFLSVTVGREVHHITVFHIKVHCPSHIHIYTYVYIQLFFRVTITANYCDPCCTHFFHK